LRLWNARSAFGLPLSEELALTKAEPPYDAAFYTAAGAAAEASAPRVLPLVFKLAAIRSIVDVGCGDGAWLVAARGLGIEDILGIDGPWIDDAALKVPLANFRRTRLDRPIAVDRRFDLAMSVEVAEHLPPERAPSFVADLTAFAPLVLFSAAIPGQGGADHVNEQWPGYWSRLFAAHGYTHIDALRMPLWNDPAIAWWYKQNLLLYADRTALTANPALAAAAAATPEEPIALVHPLLYEDIPHRVESRMRIGLRRWVRMGPGLVRQSVMRRLRAKG
jgi:hypothetical protein